MDLLIRPSGRMRCLYAETIDLAELGLVTIRRASHVEPDSHGQWTASLRPLGGPELGPFATRSQALAAEEVWLVANWLNDRASLQTGRNPIVSHLTPEE